MSMISFNRIKNWITHISNRNICNLWRRKVMITLPFIRIINLFIWVFFTKNALKYVHTCIKIALCSPDTKCSKRKKWFSRAKSELIGLNNQIHTLHRAHQSTQLFFFNVKQTQKSFNLTCQPCALMYYFVLLIAKLQKESFFSWLG